MKSCIRFCVLPALLMTMTAFTASVGAQPKGISYFHLSDFQMTSPGSLKYGLYGYDNPAILNYMESMDIQFMWTDSGDKFKPLNDWGLFAATKGIGFNVIHNKLNQFSVNDYKVSLAGGSRSFSIGVNYAWSSGDASAMNRMDYYSLGLLLRPNRYMSVGVTGSRSLHNNINEAYGDIAVRPLGNEFITLFGDYLINNGKRDKIEKDLWSAGAAIEVIDGLRLTGRYFETKQFTAGIQLGLGHLGFSTQSHFGKNEKHAYNSYGIRIGGYDRNLITRLFPSKKYASMDLNGEIKYQRYILFDRSNTLKSLIAEIDAVKSDRNTQGLVINTSGLKASREMLWEVREKLRELRSAGKKVVIFIDNPGMDIYHFASVADKIVMDPLGMISIQGYRMGMTYYKGTLEKLGVGFDEWRFFKYKSAMETLSRQDMSPADSIQRQALTDGFYNIARTEISEGRNISPEEFDDIVNRSGMLTANEALYRKLVDTLGRWPEAEDIVRKMTNRPLVSVGRTEKLMLPSDNYWGEFRKIAVIYALGACAMDDGIKARKLVKDVEAAGKDNSVAAIVLRVDSPGGDAMASDYIAEAVKKARTKKPVIVSQGTVAASGGYWLSMYGTRILAAPNTITGSIGVIGGWVYNKGLKEKLGFASDYVKRGEHADLGFGAVFPLIGLQLPDRNLDDAEYARMRSFILGFYEGFVTRVASGRNLSNEYVDSVGQGRVWTGTDGLRLKLIDEIGGLDRSITLAKELSGIEKDDRIRIVEYPAPRLFDLGFITPKFFGITTPKPALIDDLAFRFRHNGQPMTILPFEYTQMIREF